MSTHAEAAKLENFERAFRDGSGGCRRTCECGKTYFHDDDGGYDWEEGEIEQLRKDKNATALDYCPSDISFEGKQYVDACPCWHERAKQIMRFLDSHGHKIADYFRLEKERKQEEADHSPTVEA